MVSTLQVVGRVPEAGDGDAVSRLDSLVVLDQDGNAIERPTRRELRQAVLGLLEETGASVFSFTIDGHVNAFVWADPGEQDDGTVEAYYEKLIECAQEFVETLKATRSVVGGTTSKGGDA